MKKLLGVTVAMIAVVGVISMSFPSRSVADSEPLTWGELKCCYAGLGCCPKPKDDG
jgi:hypothetical protein